MANQGGNNDNSNRGFASMDDDKQRKIAQKCGEAVSQDREHMSEIGRKGGEARGRKQGRGNGSAARENGSTHESNGNANDGAMSGSSSQGERNQ